ncbi:hypothetical protein GUITHDRAFT_155016 [Guillardia theta CCMP2712]|uniref:Uncharacterized protein n=1 Tax=Guillardia theta (strain CCMP2712) TaxID=905079 RepID=L1IMT3_GUITC|nr:hypothetical protein GUITHDRAFT_155016 [Guillardia theta CCMP2712]EKX37199.1 hypothetical protein GUITHDRAFT_155016 [Guillardia theta CCMP2712]|eukprot:XP_005824179.1 hypothetical protein GUITHDRAFT_155016 [Guillardia theta CCMP2712]
MGLAAPILLPLALALAASSSPSLPPPFPSLSPAPSSDLMSSAPVRSQINRLFVSQLRFIQNQPCTMAPMNSLSSIVHSPALNFIPSFSCSKLQKSSYLSSGLSPPFRSMHSHTRYLPTSTKICICGRTLRIAKIEPFSSCFGVQLQPCQASPCVQFKMTRRTSLARLKAALEGNPPSSAVVEEQVAHGFNLNSSATLLGGTGSETVGIGLEDSLNGGTGGRSRGGGGGGGGGDGGGKEGGDRQFDGSFDSFEAAAVVLKRMKKENFNEWFNRMLRDYPIRTKSIVTGIAYGLADIAAQLYELFLQLVDGSEGEGKVLLQESAKRCIGLVLVGILWVGPCLSVWFNVLEKVFPGKSLGVTMKRAVADQIFGAPFFIMSIFALTSFWEGQSMQQVQEKLQERLVSTFIVGVWVWFPFQVVNQGMVPLQYRVVAQNVVNFFWDAFLSITNHAPSNREGGEEGEAAARRIVRA